MKKAISLLLSLAMLLGIGAMISVSAADNGIKVGFGQYDFTPADSVNMTGIDPRNSEGTLTPEDRLMATVVAISDADGNIALICTVDMLKAYGATTTRQVISKATGVPVSNIHISATHTHSAPQPSESGFEDSFNDGFADAAKQAIADMSPVTTKIGSVDVPLLNHVRHYWRQAGIVNGNNFTTDGAGKCLGSIVKSDSELQIIRFVREDKKDVVMLNWQIHPTSASCLTDYGRAHKQYLSADFIGYTRRYIEAQDNDTLVAYYSGASGNLTPHQLYATMRDPENVPEDTTVFGQRLAEYALTAMKTLKTVNVSGPVKSIELLHKAPDKSMTAISGAELGAICIGDALAFAGHSYEMFSEHGQYVKENSPFEMTFVLTNCNGDRKYIPTIYAFDYPELFKNNPIAYEVSSCLYAQGTGEDLANSMVAMLNVLYK